ncbi:hypothetical protein R9C00_17800 [Flammeovirgaceae bacterium SG7u.111]|nr:hypothetical protein [Flammeovirgaceae bacterium SG7u.132]WPO33558.1 hypothetical protein R9C00_17800 [Flammeovirgaceae bacterium SG7u.111]
MKEIYKKIPVLFFVFLSLLLGIWSGWFRLGFQLPAGKTFITHGAIMVGSFLGTVIMFERIVTLKKTIYYLFPIVNGLSIVFFLLGEVKVGYGLLCAGGVGMNIIFGVINVKYPQLPHKIMWVAAMCWLVGNVLLFMDEAYLQAITWWMSFLLLTIAAERLELNQFLPITNVHRGILLVLMLFFVVGSALPFHGLGKAICGVSMGLIALWLLKYDMVWKSVKKPGLHRYSAVLLIMGYTWLLISGMLIVVSDYAVISYDALVHTFFIGFIMSMIFAHGPIILPGVLKLKERPFHQSLYVWAVLLQLTLLARVLGSSFLYFPLQQWAGIGNGLVILGFIINMRIIVANNTKKAKLKMARG